METFLLILFYVFVIAFVAFFTVGVHGIIVVSEKEQPLPKHCWVGLFGLQICNLCMQIINLIMESIE
jgi:hypothetical protein